MKKWISMLLALLMLCTVACAEGTDFSAMTDDELHALVDGARNELVKRELVAAEDTVLFEQNGVSVYLTGEYEVRGKDDVDLYLEAVVVNDSEYKVVIACDSASVNGWNVFTAGISDTDSGKKHKDDFTFEISAADISTYEEIEEIEMAFSVINADTYETLYTIDPVVVHFNAD